MPRNGPHRPLGAGPLPHASPRFVGLLHHTDAEREWAYDRQSPVGRLDEALDEATAKNWTLVDMKQDWKRVFPFEQEGAAR